MRELINLFEPTTDPQTIRAIKVSLASPEQVRSWSFGEVKKPETINYRTFKPEKEGLFCAKIFGPVRDYECLCGKYKRMKHRGLTCDRCGVEVISADVRRKRMGHIELAAPVAHIWFVHSIPSRIGAILDLSPKELDRILYFESYIVLDPRKTTLHKGQVLTRDEYYEAKEKFGGQFETGMGAEAVERLLKDVDQKKLSDSLRKQMSETQTETKRKKLLKRLKVVDAFLRSGVKPEWMILRVVPVIPPDLRPLVPLEGGRFAASDLNELYRRVINRHNRLKKLMALDATPELILNNEKRMLQEAVDALFENGRRGRVVYGRNKRPLKSLSDLIKGKQGRFRQNLLGKRVDFSGRTVIVVGPELRLHQCGLPKIMALELFKPFVIGRLIDRGLATTVKAAKKMVEREESVVWDILDEVVREHPILLNRAPTLHRLSMQGFEPILTEQKAIQLHPLVCTAFNADFDGDQMAVHLPLSVEAQTESRVLLMSTNNILSPAHGKPIINPTQDIVLGLYYLTRERVGARGEGMSFGDLTEARQAYDNGAVDLHARVKVRVKGKLIQTTPGRVIMADVVPEEMAFEDINKLMTKKELARLVDVVYRRVGLKATVIMGDRLKDLGFHHATMAGISVAVKDMIVPSEKKKLIEFGNEQAQETEDQYREGVITEGEKYNKLISIWNGITNQIAEEMKREISYEDATNKDGKKEHQLAFNPLFMMIDSGARGSEEQMRQLAGVRGLMAKPSGEIIPTPITSNLREGLSMLQYFISTHGARKGLADTALKTATAGYLTRRMVDVAQDSIVTENDCGTLDGIEVTDLIQGGEVKTRRSERSLGRVALTDIINSVTGEVIVHANEEIDEARVEKLSEAGETVEHVMVRSPQTCQTRHGICALCYGRDLARGRLVHLGEAVGVVAAQSVGEPGTQLTMRTFHIGGTATRHVEKSTIESPTDGAVTYGDKLRVVLKGENRWLAMTRNGDVKVTGVGGAVHKFPVNYGAFLLVKDGEKVKKGQRIAEWDPYSSVILTDMAGKVVYQDIHDGISLREQVDEATGLSHKIIVAAKNVDLRPRIIVQDAGSKDTSYFLPVGSHIGVDAGSHVESGDVIAKIPRETTKTKDITGGLPRVSELLEARRPKEVAVITEINGVVSFGKDLKGKRTVIVTPDRGEAKNYQIPRGKHICVHEGDYVQAGDQLMDGTPNPHDLLVVRGVKDLAKYLVDEIQLVYDSQGVKINDKHIELIVRLMLRKVKITSPGDTTFYVGEEVDKFLFEEENARIIKQAGRPATAEYILQGISRASLSTDSFISAASFQETTKILTDAAVGGKVDYLRGLKENVIVGRLVPAGTGFPKYRKTEIDVPMEPPAEVPAEPPMEVPGVQPPLAFGTVPEKIAEE
ncbi:MAG: DNA-directed RNA polymerase subunit beta' [Nitrospirae bacterium]|nr:DNA-directed RNA polymerase subunit beta' [Nitrospirota bacterium]